MRAAPCSTCSICAAAGHDVPYSSSIHRGGSRVERHLKGRRRGDGLQEQERTGEEERAEGGVEREKGEGERTLILTNFSHPPNRV
jgi:hypothetical protein